jgi:hypothetical protein
MEMSATFGRSGAELLPETDPPLSGPQEKRLTAFDPQMRHIGAAYSSLVESRVAARMAHTNFLLRRAARLLRLLAPFVPKARLLAAKLEAKRAFTCTRLTIENSGLFDFEFYFRSYPELRRKKRDPIRHYVRRGAKEGRDPSPFFSTLGYLDANPDVRAANVNPFAHYIVHGIAECRPTVASASLAGRLVISPPGSCEGAIHHSLLPCHPRATAVDPLIEKLRRTKQNDPAAANFDPEFYAASYPDVSALDSPDALRKHYEETGRKLGRIGAPAEFLKNLDISAASLPVDFSPEIYLMLNPDLQSLANLGRLELLAHYLRHRRREKRRYSPSSVYVDPAASRELDLGSVVPEADRSPRGAFRLCCLAHVYYPDLWPVLARHIANLPPSLFDLYVNLVDSTWTEESETLVRRDFPEARIYVSPNRGRDIGGFFALLRNIDFDEYDAFCLVHTKKSPHLDASRVEKWRDDLLGAILGSSDIARQNIDLLRENGKIGLIGSGRWRDTRLFGNSDLYNRLLDGFRIEGDHRCCEYLSGTMMFVRASVLKEIYSALRNTQFENGDELSLQFHQDGQIAHAIERLIGNIVRKQGYEFAWR